MNVRTIQRLLTSRSIVGLACFALALSAAYPIHETTFVAPAPVGLHVVTTRDWFWQNRLDVRARYRILWDRMLVEWGLIVAVTGGALLLARPRGKP